MARQVETTSDGRTLNGPLQTEAEIQSAYSAADVASEYVRRRFESPLMSVLHLAQVRSVNGVMKKLRPEKTLEIAPGPGRITRHIRCAARLTCLEFNSAMIEEGKRACHNSVSWRQGNAFELGAREEFDFVYSFRFIRHFDDRDRGRLYERIVAALKPGGRFMMDAVNRSVSLPLRQASPAEYPIYDKLYDGVDEIRQELGGHGLIVESAEPVLKRFTAQSWIQNVVGPRSIWLCRSLIAAMETVPSSSPLEWIVQCRRA